MNRRRWRGPRSAGRSSRGDFESSLVIGVYDAFASRLYALVIALSATGLLACQNGTVPRVVDGHVVTHRFIPGRAYGSYAEAVRAEDEGHLEEALAGYKAASAADPKGVEPWARRGAVACKLGRAAEADDAFSKASQNDDTFEPLWRERANCALSRNDVQGALSASLRAEQLDPDREETVLLRATALERSGASGEALRELVGLTTRRPSHTAWRAQLALATRMQDVAAARLARVALAAQPLAEDPAQPDSVTRSPLESVDGALLEGDFRDAERYGRKASRNPSELAVRASALGRFDVGADQGERILAADPTNADALIAALASHDLRGDRDALKALLDRVRGRALTPPSPLATLLLLDVLSRSVGVDALHGMTLLDRPRQEPVEEALRLRLVHARDASSKGDR